MYRSRTVKKNTKNAKPTRTVQIASAALIPCLLVALALFFLPLIGTVPHALTAAQASTAPVYVTAKLIADAKSIQPGKPFRLGVKLNMVPGWHTYYKESGDAGMPTSIKWKLDSAWKAGDLLWEKPNKFVDDGIVTYGYHDETMIAAVITPPADLKDGTTVTISAAVKWLSCKDICIPGGTDVSITLPVKNSKPEADNQSDFSQVGFTGKVSQLGSPSGSPQSAGGAADSSSNSGSAAAISHSGTPLSGSSNSSSGSSNSSASSASSSGNSNVDSTRAGGNSSPSIFDQKLTVIGNGQEQMSFAAYLGCAFLGGLILNLMPCVLPVIAIKVISLMEQAHDDPARVRMQGLVFSSGIISSFLALALIVVAVQAAGQKVGWGFQFQYPGFLIAMCTIVLLFSLSLFGLFYVSVTAGQDQVDKLSNREGLVGTFFKGVLATILSTPCTAPFLGLALGFAFSQPAMVVILIFLTSALGMSLPYLLLTIKPEWMRFMPKPGVWMEKFKESMGFVLLATVAWLLYVLGTEVGAAGMSWTLGFLVAVAFCAWVVARFTDLSSSQQRRLSVQGLALGLAALSFYICIASRPELSSALGFSAAPAQAQSSKQTGAELGGLNWEPFSVSALDRYRAAGNTVLLDFTADWCLTCKVNENTVLATAPVIEKIKELKVVTMRADWTKQDESITRLLKKFDRSGVPLYVIFPGAKPDNAIVLPEVITQSLMVAKLEEAGPSR